jgi:hypothetical protein
MSEVRHVRFDRRPPDSEELEPRLVPLRGIALLMVIPDLDVEIVHGVTGC